MWGGMSGWSLLVFVDHLCCNQYIVGRPDGTSDQLRCCHMLPLVNLCCNQSIVGRPEGTSDQLRCCHMLPLLLNVAASRLRCLWAS